MKYRNSKNFPDKVSVIGFGCWSVASYNWSNSNVNSAIKAIETALEEGTNFFDVAPVYGYGDSEMILGKALKGVRDKVTLATKCGLLWNEKDGPTRNNLTKESILKEVDESLKRLGTDHIDLYQMHWPDPNTSIEESMDAMKELIKAGKIRYVGLSNFSLDELKRANEIIPIASYQGLYNLFDRNSDSYCSIPLEYKSEDEILPYCTENGIAFIPYSPLCQGLLSGRYYKGRDKDLKQGDMRLTNPELCGEALNQKLDKIALLKDLECKTGYSMTELSMGWLMNHPGITTIIVGSRTPEYAKQNASMGDLNLSQDIINELEQIFMV